MTCKCNWEKNYDRILKLFYYYLFLTGILLPNLAWLILAWPKHRQYNILEMRPLECLVIYEQLIKIEAVRSKPSRDSFSSSQSFSFIYDDELLSEKSLNLHKCRCHKIYHLMYDLWNKLFTKPSAWKTTTNCRECSNLCNTSTLRTAIINRGGRCNCKSGCESGHCKCKKENVLCNSKCHNSLSCKNK